MEREKKRKVTENGEVKNGGRKKAKEGEGEAEAEGVPPPTEGEVEEFFAILRRMRVAIKYFEKGNGDGRKLTEEWRSWLETEGLEGVKVGEKRGDGVEENVVLDLNAVPKAESNSA